MSVDPRLIQVGLEELPNVLNLLKCAFLKQHADAPTPTDAEVHAALQDAIAASLAEDDRLLGEKEPG